MADCAGPLLAARDIHRSYRSGDEELRVLIGLNLEVSEGEILIIFGPSGSGKSTLLHLLSGLDRPTKGTVYFRGTDITTFGERALARFRNREIGFIFQFYHLLPEFSALDNVMLPGLINGTDRRSCRLAARELLESVGLGERLNHKPAELSGGEQQRVAIARALINQPAVVFADEPTGNLDDRTSETIYELILELNRARNQTFVVVTHESELLAKAHRAVGLRDGRIDEAWR